MASRSHTTHGNINFSFPCVLGPGLAGIGIGGQGEPCLLGYFMHCAEHSRGTSAKPNLFLLFPFVSCLTLAIGSWLGVDFLFSFAFQQESLPPSPQASQQFSFVVGPFGICTTRYPGIRERGGYRCNRRRGLCPINEKLCCCFQTCWVWVAADSWRVRFCHNTSRMIPPCELGELWC